MHTHMIKKIPKKMQECDLLLGGKEGAVFEKEYTERSNKEARWGAGAHSL